ncbi:PREDICTED: uncharacterized protein LOC106106748 [Papilio polytes]|uniref:uncharacterized protein LOC106106748 n=1 Tax=Papilio polytes TaxID=76194 RepID=UPI0006766D92|nr:PREDICTED: uncharacterized protein LOC106106748 [Papilio polytes]
MSNLSSSSNKNHSKKGNSGRERDKNRSVASESGSSQCDTPPLSEKDGGVHGKFAGVGADSILCIAEQVAAELTGEAVVNLAEDVSYKLRQTISTIALHSEMMKKSRVDTWDVNTVLKLSDTSPCIGTTNNVYVPLGEEKLCFQTEKILNVTEYAMTSQSYVFSTVPSVTVEWITDDRSLSSNSNISFNLHNYYTNVARAILNLKKKPKQIAVEDLMTNTRIGPIFPNLFNLAVLVLNDDNLKALNVPAKKPLQSNVLDMVDALCSNPCSLDTNIQQQFQRLFPVMVSNILGNGSLAEKMVAILTKITRTWPSFIAIGESILFDYLSQGSKERLTAPMIRCVSALGRRALLACLAHHLDHLDTLLPAHPDLRDTILDASTCLLRSEPTTFLEDFVTTEYTLYEMLGDSIMPRRTLFPYKVTVPCEETTEKSPEEEFSFLPLRPPIIVKGAKLRLLPVTKNVKIHHRDEVFEPCNFTIDKPRIFLKINNCRSKDIPQTIYPERNHISVARPGAVVCSGVFHRFKYRLKQSNNTFPIYGVYML